MSLRKMHQQQKVHERANAAALRACTRFGVFVFDPANRYRPDSAVKLFKSEKLADKVVRQDWDAGHAKNYVVRTVNVCSVAEQNAIRDKKLGFGAAVRARHLGGGKTNFPAAKANADRLWSDVRAAGQALSSLSVKGKMGLTPDAVKKSAAWQSAKRAYDAAFARLQNYNTYFTKQFKRELAEERRARRGGGMGAARKSDRVQDLDVWGHKFHVDAGGNTRRVAGQHIDTQRAGDYGADPVGDGTFRMVPSGDIVSFEERNRRLKK